MKQLWKEFYGAARDDDPNRAIPEVGDDMIRALMIARGNAYGYPPAKRRTPMDRIRAVVAACRERGTDPVAQWRRSK